MGTPVEQTRGWGPPGSGRPAPTGPLRGVDLPHPALPRPEGGGRAAARRSPTRRSPERGGAGRGAGSRGSLREGACAAVSELRPALRSAPLHASRRGTPPAAPELRARPCAPAPRRSSLWETFCPSFPPLPGLLPCTPASPRSPLHTRTRGEPRARLWAPTPPARTRRPAALTPALLPEEPPQRPGCTPSSGATGVSVAWDWLAPTSPAQCHPSVSKTSRSTSIWSSSAQASLCSCSASSSAAISSANSGTRLRVNDMAIRRWCLKAMPRSYSSMGRPVLCVWRTLKGRTSSVCSRASTPSTASVW